MSQAAFKPHYEHLKNKWLDQQKELQKSLVTKHAGAFDWINNKYKNMIVGSLGSLVMMSQPVAATVTAAAQQNLAPKEKSFADSLSPDALDAQSRVILDLSYALPSQVEPLTDEQEKVIGKTLSRHFGIPVTAELAGKRLNRSYGLIGAEQHLMRYPGDNMYTHFSAQDDVNKYFSSGMAPGKGAWGYFADSYYTLTQKDIDREKYYIAVQTFLAPGYDSNVKEYSDFFKYRKMLVVNPENGKAVVADIADAGPSAWTGKHLGGSPEVMSYLDRHDGAQRGPVLYFFIDDPNDTISLGPIEPKQ